MAERRPLVLISGQLTQLPAGDTLPGVGGATAPWTRVTADTTISNGAKILAVNPNTASVTPESGDALFSSVTVLLNMNGTNGSTTFTDGVAKTWTAAGNAQISTAQSVFGGASALFDGTGDYVSTPYVANQFDWSGVDYCFECWVRPTSLTTWSYVDTNTIPTLFGLRTHNTTANFWSFGPRADGSVALYWFTGGAANVLASAAGLVTTGAWTHIAFSKSGANVRIFVNGVIVASTTIATPTFSPTTEGITLGQANNVSINGHVEGVRITRGAARYVTNFAVPTAEFALSYTPYSFTPATPINITLPAFTAGDWFIVTNSGDSGGDVRVIVGASNTINRPGFATGDNLMLQPRQSVHLVAESATELDLA